MWTVSCVWKQHQAIQATVQAFDKMVLSTLLLAFLPLAFANPVPTQVSTCTSFTVPITITAPFYPFLPPEFKSGYDATAFLLQITGRDAASSGGSPFGPPQNQTKTFDIAAQYCTPPKDVGDKVIQLLTHGIGFDQSYWHFDYNGSKEYDYAYAAAQARYATLSYDRLGIGHSSIVDPYNEQQALVELAVLTEVTTLLRAGRLHGSVPTPGHVVHVGHSYGSQLSRALASTRPDLTDGIVLTGYSTNYTWMPWSAISTTFHLASKNQPEKFGSRSSGSLTWGDKYANQYGFLEWPHFDIGVLHQAEETKQPFAVAELLTGPAMPADTRAFDKPVLVCLPFFLTY